MTEKMRALTIDKYKQAQPSFTTVAVPDVQPTEVLVKIAAASINPIDFKVQNGDLKLLTDYPMPLILGSDFSGVVTKVGAAVTDYQVGDQVYGRPNVGQLGAFAEYIAVDQKNVAKKPDNLDLIEAASIPLVGLTSYQALHDTMNLQRGQKVFIQAGSGGIGTIAIQIAKSMGAYVATTTSAKNVDMVKSLGADEVIDYHKDQFQDVLSNYDAALDTLGGDALLETFKIVKPGGKVVSLSGIPDGKFAKAEGLATWKQWLLALAAMKINKAAKQNNAEYDFLSSKPSGAELSVLAKMIENDELHPMISQVFEFDDIQNALDASKTGRVHGKIVVKIDDENK